MYDAEHVVVVTGIYLDEDIIDACGVMALYHLGDITKGSHHTVEVGRVLKVKTNKRASFVTQRHWVKDELRALDNALLHKFLDSLMYGSSRHMTCTGHLQERYAGIIRYHGQYLPVECIKFTHIKLFVRETL